MIPKEEGPPNLNKKDLCIKEEGPSSFLNHSAKGMGSPKVVYTNHLFSCYKFRMKRDPLFYTKIFFI